MIRSHLTHYATVFVIPYSGKIAVQSTLSQYWKGVWFVSAYHILKALFSARNEISLDCLPNKRVQFPVIKWEFTFSKKIYLNILIQIRRMKVYIDEELLALLWYLNPCCYIMIINCVFYNEVDLTPWFRAPFLKLIGPLSKWILSNCNKWTKFYWFSR